MKVSTNHIVAAYDFDNTSSDGSDGSNNEEGERDGDVLRIGGNKMSPINHKKAIIQRYEKEPRERKKSLDETSSEEF